MMQEFWVFGYGSLMWRPGFDYVERHQALIHGLHRRLCIYSWHHRGTPQQPGLVMGLDRGGACRGIAYRVRPEDWETTVEYLRGREQVTAVYLERSVRAHISGEAPRSVDALTYVADRSHAQYAGALSVEDQLRFVLQGKGVSGPCNEYVRSAVEHIREMGLHDGLLEHLSHKLAQVT
jgi:cation transport protein ChaC